MSESRRPEPPTDRDPAPRKPWTKPSVTTLETSSAELAGGGGPDSPDLS